MAREFYAPVLVTAVPVDGDYVIRAVNDAPQACELSVNVSAVDMAGNLRALHAGGATVETTAVDVLTIKGADLNPDEMLHFTWETGTGANGSDTFAPKPYKDYNLQAPNLTQIVSGNTLTLTAQTLALFVAIEADVPGRFDHNAFTLLPGQTKVVQFTPADPADKPKFTLRDLHSATYA